MKTVAGVFLSMAEAELAVRDLERAGVANENINLIAGNDAARHDEYLEKSRRASTGTGAAAASGAATGGGAGILASLALMAIPGVGPVIAGGAIATILAGFGIGAAAGGLIGAFRNMGMSHEEAPFYEEAVRRGLVLVVAQVNDPMEQEAVSILERHGALDLRAEVDTWRASGWSGPASDPHPYTADDSIRAHETPGDE